MELNEAPVVGHIGPVTDGVDTEFWNALQKKELKIQRCQKCKEWHWGAVWRCGECGSWDIGWEKVEPKGKVFSWIRTHQAFTPEWKGKTPFTTLLVELPQAGGKRLMGILVGDETGLKVGMPVEGVFQEPSALTDNKVILRWRLAK